METYTIFNRTTKTLQGTWDGRHYDIGPGETQMHPESVALAFKRQNPQMGSLDPSTGSINYLISIKELEDPLTPIEVTNAPEVWNREKLAGARPSELVPGDNGLYGMGDWRRGQPLDVNFNKNS